MDSGFWSRMLQFAAFLPLGALTCIIPYLTIKLFLTPEAKLWRKFVLAVGMGIAAGTVIFVGDAFNILAMLPFSALCVWLGTRDKALAKCAVFLIVFTLAATISAMLDNIRFNLLNNTIALPLLRTAAWALIYLYLRRLRRGAEEVALSNRLWRLLLGMSIAPFAVMLAGVALTPDGGDDTAILVMLPFVLLTCLSLLTAIFVLARQQALERQWQLAQFHQTYYDQLERQQNQVRRQRHDMTNQLQTLSAMPPPEVGPYLRQLLDSPAMLPARRYSGNSVFNVVLTAKAVAMDDAHIRFDCAAPLPETLPFAPPDLCAILCNALDNAMEACLPLLDAQRQVVLRARADKGLLVMQVKNPYLFAPMTEKGRLRSSKKDAQEHGYGTESIRAIAQKYGGTVEFRAADGEFELMLWMPFASPAQPLSTV